ncbi:hypothetical protein Dda_6869 [Drechslerella dactyloides]|uniref:Uncharacterized protein n=1 Tax=Drechslerella dactyloides TaxID=74499 RepID=A0AAD6IUC3_DREDA|nr:hypothetical protein Dda_6869 [Drechslerella dactyloides]
MGMMDMSFSTQMQSPLIKSPQQTPVCDELHVGPPTGRLWDIATGKTPANEEAPTGGASGMQ